MLPESQYGHEYLVLREPLFVATTLRDEVRLWAPRRQRKVTRAVMKECAAFGLELKGNDDLARFSSGQRVLVALLLSAETSKSLNSTLPVLLYRMGNFLSADWRAKVGALLGTIRSMSAHSIEGAGVVAPFTAR